MPQLAITLLPASSLTSKERNDPSNDYGKECEVSCNSYLVLSKGQQLKNETTGKLTPEISQRVLGTENTWTLVTASDPSAAIELKAVRAILTTSLRR